MREATNVREIVELGRFAGYATFFTRAALVTEDVICEFHRTVTAVEAIYFWEAKKGEVRNLSGRTRVELTIVRALVLLQRNTSGE